MHSPFYFFSLISQESVSANFFTLNSNHGFPIKIDAVVVLSTQVLIYGSVSPKRSSHIRPQFSVKKVDSAIHRINDYPLDSAIDFANTCPLDSDLSGG